MRRKKTFSLQFYEVAELPPPEMLHVPVGSHAFLVRLYPLAKVMIHVVGDIYILLMNNADCSLSALPTLEWQDRLSKRLASSMSSPHFTELVDPSSPRTCDDSGSPFNQRRRLSIHQTSNNEGQPDWSEMYTMDNLSGTIRIVFVRCSIN